MTDPQIYLSTVDVASTIPTALELSVRHPFAVEARHG